MKKAKIGQVLPARMRQKLSSSGRVFYYYDTCAKPRKWLPLGTDYLEALKKYADFEMEYNAVEMAARINAELTFKKAADRYLREVVPLKKPSTQRDNLRELENLLAFFNDPPAPLSEIRPQHIREYLDWRSKTAKVRANREVALFSHIFNKAREWGYTDNANPCKDEEEGLSAAKDLLGHKNSSMTVHYVRHRKGKLVNPTRMGKFRDYVEQDGKCRTNEQACGNEKTA